MFATNMFVYGSTHDHERERTDPPQPSRTPRQARPDQAGNHRRRAAILREEGLSKVTMRRIATALDTGPASLYVYVSDTEDLHAQILDALLGPVTAAAPEPGRGATG